MPNWCSNNLYIKGDKDKVTEFVQRTLLSEEETQKRGQSHDILGKLYPTPQELVDTKSGFFGDPEKQAEQEKAEQANLAKYGYKDWYDWNCAKWGTKWGDCDTFLADLTDESVSFEFQSAWGPPIEGIAHISSLFPELTFVLTYEEQGMDFYGLATFDGTGDYLDNCEEISSIDGMVDVDWDADDYTDQLEHNHEKLLEAKEKLLIDAGILWTT